MGDPLEKIGPAKGSFEEILMQIPGFKGYLRAEYRRDADRLQRQHLGQELKRARQTLDKVKQDLAQKLAFTHITRLETLTDKIYRVASRIENADEGYSGFFDSVKVGEKELALIYEVDKDLLSDVSLVAQAASKLSPSLPDAGIDRKSTRLNSSH